MIHKFFKKILICLMVVLLLFTSSIDIFGSSKAHANFVTKPIEITAKKTLKDLAEHVAIGMAEQIVQNYLIDEIIDSAVTKVDAGFAPVCLDKKVKNLKDCPSEKLAQAKRDFTAADKKLLRDELEGVIEQKTYTSYKWQKFLDFFIPVFLANGLVAFFDSLLDPESEGLINEIAQEALINSGLLKPVFVPPAVGSLEQLDFSKHVESVDVSSFYQELNTNHMYFVFDIVLKPNVTLSYSVNDSKGRTVNTPSSNVLSFTVFIRTISLPVLSISAPYYLAQIQGVEALVGSSGVIYFSDPDVIWRGNTRYNVIDGDNPAAFKLAANESKLYLMDYWGAKFADTSVNARMNNLLAMMATNPSTNFKFDDSVNIKLPPPKVKTDYGTQTGTDKIKDTDGKVKLKGIDSYKFTYQNKDVYPSDQSSTGWKVRKTGEDIAVGEDVSVKDKDEKETEPEKPTEPNNPSCNESDDMEVDSGQCEGVPYFGSKLEFIFGNATGNKNHIERSLAMELQLNSIGIFDDAKGKKLVLDNLSNAFDDPSSIRETQENSQVVRTSVLTGPNGELKVESVWDKEKLISVKLGEDVGEEPGDIENSEDIEDSREYTNDGTDNDETLDNGGVLDSANFAQKTYNPNKFSDEGIKYYSSLAGRPIKNVDDLVDALRNGDIKPSQVPIDYIEREGNTLILNTRSSIALTQAGIPRNQWNAVNRTGNEMYEQMLTDQLVRNKLTSSGTPTVRPSGAK